MSDVNVGGSGRPVNLPAPTDVSGNEQLVKSDKAALEGMWKATLSDIKAVDSGTMTRAQLSEALHVRQLQLQQLQTDQPALEAAKEVGSVSEADLEGFEDQLTKAQLALGAAIATNARIQAETPVDPAPGGGGNPCFGTTGAAFFIALMQCAEVQKLNQQIMGPLMVKLRDLQVEIRDTRMQIAVDQGEAEKDKAQAQAIGSIVAGSVGLIATVGGGVAGAWKGGGDTPIASGLDIGGKFGGSMGQIASGVAGIYASQKETDIAGYKSEEIKNQFGADSASKSMDDSIKSFGSSGDLIGQIYQIFTQTSREQKQIRWGAQG
jgi:hypothetical protein